MKAEKWKLAFVVFFILLWVKGVTASGFSLPQNNNSEYGCSTANIGSQSWIARLATNNGTCLQSENTARFRLLVLLGDFSDLKGRFSAEDFQKLYFDANSDGTMTAYFRQCSNSRFELTGEVVEGWTTAAQKVEYYTSSEIYPRSASGFAREILVKADKDIDFGEYDNDGPDGIPDSGDDDGAADAVMIVFAGYPSGYTAKNALTPVQLDLMENAVETNDRSYSGKVIIVRTVFLVPELKPAPGNAISPIGLACHEFGHVLGLPDQYDLTLQSQGLGQWCLMARGGHVDDGTTPSHMCAWCKMRLGWVTPVDIEGNSSMTVLPVEDKPTVYKLWEDPFRLSRYFLIENRQKKGFDAKLNGNGMLIYHVDETRWCGPFFKTGGSQNDIVSHKLIDLEEADGLDQLDHNLNAGDAGDPYPGTSGNTVFDDFSNPSARDYDNHPSGIVVSRIASTGDRVTADVTVPEKQGYALVYDTNGITGAGWVIDQSAKNYWAGVLFQSAEAGYLEAIDIGTIFKSCDYTIKIYSSLEDTIPNGLLAEVSGRTSSAGWTTVVLPSKVQIGANDSFFISLVYPGKGVFVDQYSDYTGRSYIADDGTNFWKLPSKEYGNFNIRARIRTKSIPLVLSCDFNADGKIDVVDAVSLIKSLHANPGNLSCDYDKDGKCGIMDVIDLLLRIRRGNCQ